MIQYNDFPEGKKRIVTFSYDDGQRDEPLVALFNRYRVKATFHLNGKELDDNELDAVAGGACAGDPAFEAVSNLNCPECGRNDKWDMTGYSNGKCYWQCCACGKKAYTLDSEGNTVLH
jgi:hypothetical protein